ncbi:MAG: 3-dehydroquinate synthase II [Desulfomonile tiedjei]|nr:3-dehydroquinate synthase II [Desulfomonile tiedjei]
MAKQFWVRLSQWNEAAAQAALEADADAVWPPEGFHVEARKIDGLRVAGKQGDLDFEIISLGSAADVDRAAELARSGRLVVVDCPNWRLIPWENLVGSGQVLALVKTRVEAEQALTALESGLSGVVLESDDPLEIGAVGELIRRIEWDLELLPARITSVEPVGVGERACVDVAGLFTHGEGLLVGDKAAALFLVAAETAENPFVASRPFRVNAGGLHHYILCPDGKTGYLSELRGGVSVLAVDPTGRARTVVAGRIKIERRPLIRVVADRAGIEASVLLQNAETVCLVQSNGEPISVTALESGHEVLVHPGSTARHLGKGIEEWLLEK